MAEEANEKHLRPWSELAREQGVEFTPLTPYIDKELLKQNHLFVDGSAIEGLGFRYEVPEVRTAAGRDAVAWGAPRHARPRSTCMRPDDGGARAGDGGALCRPQCVPRGGQDRARPVGRAHGRARLGGDEGGEGALHSQGPLQLLLRRRRHPRRTHGHVVVG